jgi:formylglycine-generating enzyme
MWNTLYWLSRVYGETYPEVIRKALPDTLVWRERLAYNEPYVYNYLRHPAYRDYPVVGVNWVQANEYAAWRTDRVNEMILIREGILQWDPDQVNERNFNTEAYLAGQYEGLVRRNLRDLDPRVLAKEE